MGILARLRPTETANSGGAVLEEAVRPVPEAAPAECVLTPLPQARSELRSAILDHRARSAEVAELTVPVRKLDAIISEARLLDQQLAGHAAEFEHRLGEWLIDPIGERPSPVAATIGLRQRRDALSPDVAAATSALPAAQARLQAAGNVAAAASRHLQELVAIAAAHVVRSELLPQLQKAMLAALAVQAQIAGVATALQSAASAAGAPEHLMLSSSATVRSMLIEARREPAVELDVEGGRRLLEALKSDPSASWGTPA